MKQELYITTLTSDGQVTLPKEILSNLGVNIGDSVMFVWDGERVNLMNPIMNEK